MASLPPIFLAVDTPDIDIAKSWIEATNGYVSGYKLGLEFFAAFGSAGVRKLKEVTDADLFLDLKLHDIPNTVAGAAKQVAELAPKFLTVHASGGRAMIAAAVEQAPNVEITAVTILTSLSKIDLQEIGFVSEPLESAVKLAILAKSAGARAIVCSPLEIAAIRNAVGPEMTIIAPGVRPIAARVKDDQARTMDPKSAMSAGATYLVIGRPITNLWIEGFTAMRDGAASIASELS